ncbi:MAG TPA: response regulator [Candidatus Acidoferrum sp.]
MAKILVADDNSNIQKMVSLALKDQGIDVVAVGNGEAAVRKIADLRPDLVLADVFMPVRNGYEVCQFVKMDSSLSHIPVILLVGAFDPLDEQEAQRVGADGVLKKPFIPPDPLISMVKSALQRSGAGHTSAPAARPAELETLGAKEMLTPSSTSLPTPGATPVQEFQLGSSPAAESESFVEEIPAKPEPVQIDSSAQPFGSLLEAPAAETPEDSSYPATSSPEFTMEHDWRDRDETETVEEEEDEEPVAWRPEGTADEEEIPAVKAKKPKSSVSDWRTGGFEQIAASKSRNAGWEPEEEEKPARVETAPVASSPAPETPAAPPAPVKETAPVPVASKPFVTDTWAPPIPPPAAPVAPAVLNEAHSTETATAVVEDKPKISSEPKPAEKKDAKDSWFSVSSSPWESELKKANQLASTWDAPVAANLAGTPKNGTEKSGELSPETQAVIEEAALPPATVDAIREEAALATEDTEFVVEEAPSASEGNSFYAREEEGVLEPNSPTPTAPTLTAPAPASPNMDDLVAKVLAKMSPEVLQAVTREILKPVVEAMVKEELKSKKQ